jgi:hypothetical protein
MTRSSAVIRLSLLVTLLALVAAGAGLFWPGGNGVTAVTSLRGETVELYEQGIYQYDTRFVGALNRGTDAAVLLVALPLLGVLAYILYVYASAALGATAYNDLFLVYVALFGASLAALLRLLAAIDVSILAAHIAPQAPWRAAGVFMLVCGVVTTAVWLGLGLLPRILAGELPEHLDTYATPLFPAHGRSEPLRGGLWRVDPALGLVCGARPPPALRLLRQCHLSPPARLVAPARCA